MIFICKQCGKEIVKYGDIQVTFCVHFPPKDEKKDDELTNIKDIFNEMGINL